MSKLVWFSRVPDPNEDWDREPRRVKKIKPSDMLRELSRLHAQVAALVELVREAEWGTEEMCPWCQELELVECEHKPDCPARPWLEKK